MIKYKKFKLVAHNGGFRLLNSEIGNDHESYFRICVKINCCFRLLNSEIGNDRKNKG